MTAQEVYKKILDHEKNIDYGKIFANLGEMNSGAWKDVYDIQNTGYYQWLSSAMDYLKPKQVVELGGAMGVGTMMIGETLPADSRLFSITLPEHGLEFSFMKKDYPNVIKIVGDDLDLNSWPDFMVAGQRIDEELKQPGLCNTDFWFIDTEHTYEQLHKELELYKRFFKNGAIICFDDINLNDGMKRAWSEVTWDKFESPLHYTGWGISVYRSENSYYDPNIFETVGVKQPESQKSNYKFDSSRSYFTVSNPSITKK